jgi:hypothetical protein
VLDPDGVETLVEDLSATDHGSLAEDSRRTAITRRLTDSEQRLDQFKAALAHGADPAVVSTWVNEAQATSPERGPTSHCSTTKSRPRSAGRT